MPYDLRIITIYISIYFLFITNILFKTFFAYRNIFLIKDLHSKFLIKQNSIWKNKLLFLDCIHVYLFMKQKTKQVFYQPKGIKRQHRFLDRHSVSCCRNLLFKKQIERNVFCFNNYSTASSIKSFVSYKAQ